MPSSKLKIRLALIAVLIGVSAYALLTWNSGTPNGYLRKAERAIASGNYGAADIYLKNLLQQDPDHAEGNITMSDLILLQSPTGSGPNRYTTNKHAIIYLDIAAEKNLDNLLAQQRFLDALLEVSDLRRAIPIARRIAQTDPDWLPAQFTLACDAVDRMPDNPNMPVPSRSASNTATDSVNGSVDENTMITNDPIASENIGHAVDRLRNADVPFHYKTLSLAHQYYSKQQDEPRRQQLLDTVCNDASRLDTDQIERLSNAEQTSISQLLVKAVTSSRNTDDLLRRTSQAIACLSTMSKSDVLNPELPVTNIERVISAMVGRFGDRQFNDQQLAIKRQVLAQADQCVDDILARGSKNLSLMLYAANRAIEMGQMDRAIDITLRADQLMAENSGAGHPRVTFQLVQIARHLINTGESDSAETLIETLTTNRESVGWGSFLSGEMASQQGRDDEAILYFMQARSQLGDLPVIRLAMIDAYARAGRWEELLKLAESTRVIIDNSELVDSSESRWSGDQLGPAEPFILRQIQALLALDRWDDAIVHFSELQNTPVESRAIPLLAEWLWKHGQRDDAKRLMTDAIRKYSGDKPILSQDQSEAVILMLDEVKAEMPEMPNLESLQNTADQQPIVLDESNNRKLTTHRLLGDQAMKRYAETSDPGDASEAELHYRAVLKQSPRDAITGNNLAWLLANELGHPEEAVDLIETVIGDVPLELVPADIVHTLANAYRMNRQYEKSLAVIRTKLEQHPDHAAMWLELGQIQFDMRDFEQARAALDNAIRNGITGTKLETANGLLGKIRDTQP